MIEHGTHENKPSPAPWKVCGPDDDTWFWVADADGHLVAKAIDELEAIRIVDAVNAIQK